MSGYCWLKAAMTSSLGGSSLGSPQKDQVMAALSPAGAVAGAAGGGGGAGGGRGGGGGRRLAGRGRLAGGEEGGGERGQGQAAQEGATGWVVHGGLRAAIVPEA